MSAWARSKLTKIFKSTDLILDKIEMTHKGREAADQKEGLLLPEGIDRRTEISFKTAKDMITSYTSNAQILAAKAQGHCVGTGSVYCKRVVTGDGPEDYKDVRFVLTCAHNFVFVAKPEELKTEEEKAAEEAIRIEGEPISEEEKQAKTFRDIYVYKARYGQGVWMNKWPVKYAYPHPYYNGDEFSGFDIAIGIFGEEEGPEDYTTEWFSTTENVVDCYNTYFDPKNLEEGGDFVKSMMAEITGYPGDIGKRGYLWTHKGKLHHCEPTDLGGWCLYYSIDTTPGNSGSAVRVIDEDFVNRRKDASCLAEDSEGVKYIKKVTIAVHTGKSEEAKRNGGTLITRDIIDWRDRTIEEHVKKEADAIATGNWEAL